MKDILAIIAMSPYFDNVTLTRSSLRGILTDAINMFIEQRDCYAREDDTDDDWRDRAIEEVLNGLDAEADLIKEGEILPVQGRTFA